MTTSAATLTESLTLVTLSDSQRKALSEFIALTYLDSMSTKDLETFFLDTQMEYLQDSYSDAELIGEIENLITKEEYEEILNETAA
jgi:hypothetical protein